MTERLAELMHLEWLALMAEQGWHSPEDCPKWDERAQRSGWPFQPCDNCRSGLVPWPDVPEAVKEVNRRGVLRFLRELGITPEQAERGVNVGRAVEIANDMRGLGCLYDARGQQSSNHCVHDDRIEDLLRALGEVDRG